MVNASGTIYTQVVVRIGNVVSIAGGPSYLTYDVYDPSKNQLTIPAGTVQGITYTNMVTWATPASRNLMPTCKLLTPNSDNCEARKMSLALNFTWSALLNAAIISATFSGT